MSSDEPAASTRPLSEQAELEKLTRELAEVKHELETFTYSVAHDLRAPLRGVAGYLDALREDHGASLPQPAGTYLNNAISCAARMQSMIEDILEISRLGRRELHLTPVPLSRVVMEARHEVLREMPAREIEWRIGELPTVTCDPGLVREVFEVLLSNAVKFTRRVPQAVIQVSLRDHHGCPVIAIRDNGVGFDLQAAANLFAPFARLHDPQEYPGSATSLAKAAKIVRRHGGRIWAEAAEAEGATFYFTLAPESA